MHEYLALFPVRCAPAAREPDNADAVEWKTRLDAEIPTRCLALGCCFFLFLHSTHRARCALLPPSLPALPSWPPRPRRSHSSPPCAAPSLVSVVFTFPSPTPWLTPTAHSTGSLHQCEDTTVFFFDSGNASPKTLVLLPQGQGPSGDTTLADVEAIGPLQVIGDITTPDAQSFPFTLQIAAGVSFDVSGPFFLSPWSGIGTLLFRKRPVFKTLHPVLRMRACELTRYCILHHADALYLGITPLRSPSPLLHSSTPPQTYGFLPDGTGKNLNLPRSVQTPLPGASQCNPASVGQANAAQPTSTR